jgi:hypothetical protein
LIYLITIRPNLAFAVISLAQSMSKPLESHWVEANGVLGYIQGTLEFVIKYTDSFDVRLTGFLDSDWAGNLNDRRSITCYAFNIGSRAISLSNKKKNNVSLSLEEAEYQVVCATMFKEVWLRRLLHDARGEKKDPTIIKCDNQISSKLANNRVFHKNSKHSDT